MNRDDAPLLDKLGHWLVEAIGPILIMIMAMSLAWLLIDITYWGPYPHRVKYVFALFVVAVTLISRISIIEGYTRAAFYGVVLSFAITIVGLAFFGHVAAIFIVGLLWWMAGRLTWDVTYLDDSRDVTAQGLIALAQQQFHRLTAKRPTDSLDQRKSSNNPAEPAAAARPNDKPHFGHDYLQAKDSTAWPRKAGGAAAAEAPAKSPKEASWYIRMFHRRQANAPGLWVLLFLIAGVLVFSIGQAMIPGWNTAARQQALYYFIAYVSAALALLMLTSLMGLQRYVAGRGAVIPSLIARSWIVTGLVTALIILVVAMWLPLPTPQLAIGNWLPRITGPERRASSVSILDEGQKSEPGQRATRTQGGGDEPGSAGQGQSGDGGQGGSGQSGAGKGQGQAGSGQSKSGSGQNQSGSNRNQSGSNQNQSGSQQQQPSRSQDQTDASKNQSGTSQNQSAGSQSQSDQSQGRSPSDGRSQTSEAKDGSASERSQRPADSRGQPTDRNNDQQASDSDDQDESAAQDRSGQPQRGSSGRASQGSSRPQQNESPPRSGDQRDDKAKDASQQQTSPPPRPNFLALLSTMLQWIIRIAIWLVIVYLMFRYRHRIVAELQKFLSDLAAWWEKLFGGKARPDAQAELAAAASAAVTFQQFQNPFRTGMAQRLRPDEVVVYTFRALEAWSRQMGAPRAPEVTPRQFAQHTAIRFKDRRPLSVLVELYDQVAYAGKLPRSADVQPLATLWQQMESSGNAPAAPALNPQTGN